MNKKLVFSVLLVCLLAGVAVLAFSQNSQTVRWEYTTLGVWDLGRSAIQTEMNKLGQEGWEFVSASAFSGSNNPDLLIFKRRLP
jgi:hypothetical protein